jgi:hypothetical protein
VVSGAHFNPKEKVMPGPVDFSGSLPEVPAAGVQSIPGASTSVTAFVGTACHGPMNIPANVTSFDDYRSVFGGQAADSELGYAVREFFQNGGAEAYVVRTADAQSSLLGDRALRHGLYALEEVDLFNLLCLPGVDDRYVLAAAQDYCAERGAFFIMDAPIAAESPDQLLTTVVSRNFPKSEHAAIYYPWVYLADDQGKRRLAPPSGGIAGLYARTDMERGVWKAPSGNRARLVDVQALGYLLDDDESDRLNHQGINCLRMFPELGAVCWSASTLRRVGQMTTEFDHVPVRRMANFLEDSISRGLQWAMFEPNNEALWARIRKQVDAFMHRLFVDGAFQGLSEREAYLVKCDGSTTRPEDVEMGHVNLHIGFAALKPDEFVMLTIQQLAGAAEENR